MSDGNYLCVHGHFYQPPRGNPFSSEPLVEHDAAPFRNWNERITHECYAPNAAIGNFDLISFNIGGTLARWLAENAPETYQSILEADAKHLEQYGVGNAIAQPVHHVILPLARHEDKVTQVVWGLAAFEHRFGHTAQGMWLPEMAVDLETLEVLAAHGVEWTILTESQVEGRGAGAGPYWVRLPSGGRIKVFVRDEHLSNDIAFNLGHFGGAGRWARSVLVPRRREAGPLTLIATDGETFGHHWPGEEQFLHWLLTYEARAAGYEVVTLNRYVRMVEPQGEIAIKEDTAWSCQHGLARWVTGCACTPGDSSWKGALRRAFDNVRAELDNIYEDFVRHLEGVDPFALRNAYIGVVLGRIPREGFLPSQSVSADADTAQRLLTLVEAQFYRQRMYTSCTFFFAELGTHSTTYGIANAAYAIKLTREATGIDLSAQFRRDLRLAAGYAKGSDQPITAADLYDEVLEQINGW